MHPTVVGYTKILPDTDHNAQVASQLRRSLSLVFRFIRSSYKLYDSYNMHIISLSSYNEYRLNLTLDLSNETSWLNW